MGALFRPTRNLLVASFAVCSLVAAGLGWYLVHRPEAMSSKEASFRQDLFVLRQVISQYTLDKQKAPKSLDELIRVHYLKAIPVDPFTGKADWVPEFEDSLISVDQKEPGIVDVHSSSNQTASDGTAYSSW